MKDLSQSFLATKILQQQHHIILFPFILDFHAAKISGAYKKLRPDTYSKMIIVLICTVALKSWFFPIGKMPFSGQGLFVKALYHAKALLLLFPLASATGK